MATTILADKPVLSEFLMKSQAMYDRLWDEYVSAMGDLDKCGSTEDAAYYQGRIDGVCFGIWCLTGVSL